MNFKNLAFKICYFLILFETFEKVKNLAARPEWSSFLLVAELVVVVEPVEAKPVIKKAGTEDLVKRTRLPKSL